MDKLNVLSLFSGIGAFEKALENIGVDYNLVNYCEIDKYASKSYALIHNVSEDKNLRDVTTVDTSKLPPIDLVTYGFPCVPAGYLINTENGYKPIETITKGDRVLTHTNTYQNVVKTMKRTSDHIYHIKGVGVTDLQLTSEHPIYTYRNGEFVWVKVKDLTTSDKLIYNINTENVEQHFTDRELVTLGSFCAYPRYSNRTLDILRDILKLSSNRIKMFFSGYRMTCDNLKYIETTEKDAQVFFTSNKTLGVMFQALAIKAYNAVPMFIGEDTTLGYTTYNYKFFWNLDKQSVIEDKVLVDIESITREEKSIEVYNFEVENDNSYCIENVIVHNCQDISIAGKMRGFKNEETGESTRSGLFFEALRIIEDTKPKYAIAENVKNLTSNKFRNEFSVVLQSLEKAGYANYWKVLNARDYGIPQNRERVFIVSIRKDIDTFSFRFPKKLPLVRCLKDILEDKVDEKYYYYGNKVDTLISKLQEKYVIQEKEVADATIKNPKLKEVSNCITARYDAGIQNQESIGAVVVEPKIEVVGNFNEVGVPCFESAGRVYNKTGLSPTLSTAQGGNQVPKILEESKEIKVKQVGNLVHRDTFNNPQEGRVFSTEGATHTLVANPNNVPKILVKVGTKLGYDEAIEGDSINLAFPNNANKRGRVGKQESHTITTDAKMGVVTPELRIRKLTPKECFRLMGFENKDVDILIENGISNTQLYKMAGNSIVVNVLEALFRSLLLK